jgi:hypothetical protein
MKMDILFRNTRRRPRTILRSGRTEVGIAMNSTISILSREVGTEVENPISVDDKGCIECMANDGQPNAVEDGSIEDAEDGSRMEHTLQLTSMSHLKAPRSVCWLVRIWV